MEDDRKIAARVAALTHRYGRDVALDGVALEIPAGRNVGLIGPDGVGKSTLMGLLAGARKIQTGQVNVLGANLINERLRRVVGPRIAYMPQGLGSNLYADLSIAENLTFFGRLYGLTRSEREARIWKLTAATGLLAFLDRPARKLSGGMKRRLGIAQTLIGDPPHLVVDEPTSGLDPEERIRFRNLLSDLSGQDRIILLSTHIVGDISSTCETIALMDLGRIIFHGPPDDLVDSARGKVWTISTGYEDLDSWKERFPVISTVPSENGYELRIVAENPDTPEAKPAEPNLEDAYIHYMQKAVSGHLSGAYEKKE